MTFEIIPEKPELRLPHKSLIMTALCVLSPFLSAELYSLIDLIYSIKLAGLAYSLISFLVAWYLRKPVDSEEFHLGLGEKDSISVHIRDYSRNA